MAKGDKRSKPSAALEPMRVRWPSLWSDIDAFFERAMRPWPQAPGPRLGRRRWMPEMDVCEKNGNLIVRIDVSDMKQANIEVSIEGNVLTISGHREEEREIEEESFYSIERAVGRFTKSIRVPAGVTPESIQAVVEDGILTVTVRHPGTTRHQLSAKIDVT